MIVNPSNAVIAKAKSKYGKRLSAKDYSAMAKSETVAEIVRYLKTYTDYRRYLTRVGSDIHRGKLELVLRENTFENFLSLCRYSRASSPVIAYIIRRTEINELIKYLTLLAGGKPVEYIFSLPLYFNEHTDLPLDKLSGAHSYPSLLELLGDHPYRKCLEKHIPADNTGIDLAAIEDELEIYSLGKLYKSISELKNKAERSELTALFDILCDYNNYTRIMRLKRYYNLSNEKVREHLLPFGTLSGRRLDAIMAKGSYEEIREALAETPVGRRAQNIDIDSEMAVKGRYDKCRHELYFSTEPEVVLLAYYILSETELRNIITVIEGVRYSMQPQSIIAMLIV